MGGESRVRNVAGSAQASASGLERLGMGTTSSLGDEIHPDRGDRRHVICEARLQSREWVITYTI